MDIHPRMLIERWSLVNTGYVRILKTDTYVQVEA